MEENINIFALVLDELNKNDMWFTTKADPTAEEASSYYKLDEYGEPTEATVKKIAKEVSSLIGDGAVCIEDAVELWVNDALVDYKIDYKDNLVTQFEDKPVVDNIEAYENPVQFPQSKKVESKKITECILKNIQLEDEIDEWKVYSADIDKEKGKDIISTFNIYEDDEGNVITNIRIDYNTADDTYIVNYVDNSGRFHQIDYKLSDDELAQIIGKKTEAKTKKTEGAGAGYEIRGTVSSAKVNNFEIIGNTTNQYNEKIYELKCDIDVKLEDVQFESYYYGGKIDFPIDGKVTYLIVSENSNNDIDEVLTNSDIENALDGAKIKEMLGGGWIHETFTGDFSGEFDGDVYGDYYALDFEMTLTQEPVIDFIDKKVDGVMDEVTYCVYDKDNDPIDDFSDKDEAIEFAKKNGYVEVVEKYHDYQLIDADGSIDDNSYEDGDIVWEREYTKQYKFDSEVNESKQVKVESTDNHDYISKYDELDDLLNTFAGTDEDKLNLYNYFNSDKPLKDLDGENEYLYDDWLFDFRKDHYDELRAYLDEKDEELGIIIDKISESKKAERKKKQIEAFKNRKVNFNKCTKEENYQRRLDEVNNKSKNLISDMFSSNNFDSDSPAGQIVMRTSEMFNALSDKGYDVEVTFDNGESTSAIQLGQQGGKVMITITNADQPLRAFTSGNFEINDQNIKILQDIQSQIEVL